MFSSSCGEDVQSDGCDVGPPDTFVDGWAADSTQDTPMPPAYDFSQIRVSSGGSYQIRWHVETGTLAVDEWMSISLATSNTSDGLSPPLEIAATISMPETGYLPVLQPTVWRGMTELLSPVRFDHVGIWKLTVTLWEPVQGVATSHPAEYVEFFIEVL